MSFFVSDSIKEKINVDDMFSDRSSQSRKKIMSLVCIDKDNKALNFNLLNMKRKKNSKQLKLTICATLSHFETLWFESVKPSKILFDKNSIALSADVKCLSAKYYSEFELYYIELLCQPL